MHSANVIWRAKVRCIRRGRPDPLPDVTECSNISYKDIKKFSYIWDYNKNIYNSNLITNIHFKLVFKTHTRFPISWLLHPIYKPWTSQFPPPPFFSWSLLLRKVCIYINLKIEKSILICWKLQNFQQTGTDTFYAYAYLYLLSASKQEYKINILINYYIHNN